MCKEIRFSILKAVVAFLLVYLIVPFFLLATEKQSLPEDLTILIYSPTHGSVSHLKEKSGSLTVNISAFEPITEVWLNEELFRSPNKSKVELNIPFNLTDESAVFEIQAYTEKGKAEKTYTLHSETEPTKSSFQLIGILGVTATDNLNNENSAPDKDEALKTTLTLVPSLSTSWSDSKIVLKGILLREKYSEEEYAGKEIAFSQLLTGWIQKRTPLGEISAELGRNDIRTDNSNLLISEEHSKTEIFLSANMKQKITQTAKWNLGLRVKDKDSIPEPVNANYDADATEVKIYAGIKGIFQKLDFVIKTGYTVNEAKGDYRDYSSLDFSIEQKVAIGKWVPSIMHYRKEKQMNTEDPDKNNKVPYYSIHTTAVKLKYYLNQKVIFSLDSKEKTQNSNVAEFNYKRNDMTFSVTTVF